LGGEKGKRKTLNGRGRLPFYCGRDQVRFAPLRRRFNLAESVAARKLGETALPKKKKRLTPYPGSLRMPASKRERAPRWKKTASNITSIRKKTKRKTTPKSTASKHQSMSDYETLYKKGEKKAGPSGEAEREKEVGTKRGVERAVRPLSSSKKGEANEPPTSPGRESKSLEGGARRYKRNAKGKATASTNSAISQKKSIKVDSGHHLHALIRRENVAPASGDAMKRTGSRPTQ